MKITDIQVDGFGVWNGLKVESLSPNMTAFFGQNEAGKTTLMQFIRAVLYGFSPERRGIYLPPVNGGAPGGSLSVSSLAGDYKVYRQTSSTDPTASTGKVSVVGSNGRTNGQHQLTQLNSGIDETIFNNVFAVGIRELQELGTLNDTQAANELYNLTSGVDRVSLVEVMRDLEAARESQLSSGEAKSRLPQMLEQRTNLQIEIDQLQHNGRRWCQLAEQRSDTLREIEQLDVDITRLEGEAKVTEVSLQVYQQWRKRQAVDSELEKLGQVDPLPENSLERLAELKQKVSGLREQLAPIKKKRIELRRRAAAFPINKKLSAQSCRIDALCEYGPWIASLDRQIGSLNEEIELLETELVTQQKKLGVSSDLTSTDIPEVTPKAYRTLRGPAMAISKAKRGVADAERECEISRKRTEQFNVRLDSELGEHRGRDLEGSLERAGLLVSQLRRRIQIDERIEKTDHQANEIEQEKRELLERRVLPIQTSIFIGLAVVLGIMFALYSFGVWIYSESGSTEILSTFVFSCLVAGIGIIVKIVLEKQVSEDIASSSRQLNRLRAQSDQFDEEAEEIDREIPRGNGSLETRLIAAESDLKDLERMMPLESDSQLVNQSDDQAKRALDSAKVEYSETRQLWAKTLSGLGLPSKLSPKQIKRLASHYDNNSHLSKRLELRRTELEERKQERKVLIERLESVIEDVGLETISHQPQSQISELANALTAQRQMIEQRNELKQEYGEVRKQQRSLMKEYKSYQKMINVLFHAAGVLDEDEMRLRNERCLRMTSLIETHRDLCTQIAAVIGEYCSAEDIAAELESHQREQLEQLDQRFGRLVVRLQDSQEHLKVLHQRSGEISTELKILAEDERLPAARLELNCIEQKIATAVKRWQTYGLTSLLLETVRETYESERQPETLAEASQYLEALSEGKYTRIWTPLTQDILKVDDSEGHALPLDVLSRGTREAVFLSLRLALTAAYARRGIQLPMVLDDVLVNLDARRSRATVEVLRDFAASGQQLLFFTCHDHIVEMFSELEIEVRQLPSHASPNAVVSAMEFEDVEEEEEEEYLEEEEEIEAEEEEVEEELEEEEVAEEEVAEEEEGWEEVEEAPEAEAEEEVEEEVEEEYDPIAEYEEAVEDELDDELEHAPVTSSFVVATQDESIEENEFLESLTWESPEVWSDASEEDAA